MKNIELAIQKEQEYLYEKIENKNNQANIYEYLSVAGYDDLEEFEKDKFWYKLASYNLNTISDSATVLQPLAYEYYQNAIPFCFFVEYDKPFALVPLSFDKENEYNEFGLDCFKCGYDVENGGIIITHNEDFRFCISIPDNINSEKIFLTKILNSLKQFYPNVFIDGNDIMYENKKVGGTVYFRYNGMFIFAMNLSLIDMSEIINKIGIVKVKQPGNLPYIENIKNILKEEVEKWLRL